jgi:hypothetical protein
MNINSKGGINKMKRWIQIGARILCPIFFALAGCAPTQVTLLQETTLQLPRPDKILVYNFAVSPDEIKLDRGISNQLEAYINKTPRTAEEKAVGRGVADSVAKHLVTHIQTLGFFAERAAGPSPKTGNILEVEGQFISIDEGNRTERVVIGLGAGRTDVKTYVQIYDARTKNRVLAAQYQVDAKSAAKPGMAMMTAVGALAGHAIVAALTSGGLAGVSERYTANVDADGNRTAEEIVTKALGPFFVSQGWIPPSTLQEKGFFEKLTQ